VEQVRPDPAYAAQLNKTTCFLLLPIFDEIFLPLQYRFNLTKFNTAETSEQVKTHSQGQEHESHSHAQTTNKAPAHADYKRFGLGQCKMRSGSLQYYTVLYIYELRSLQRIHSLQNATLCGSSEFI
jgi:hypothetical protein